MKTVKLKRFMQIFLITIYLQLKNILDRLSNLVVRHPNMQEEHQRGFGSTIPVSSHLNFLYEINFYLFICFLEVII